VDTGPRGLRPPVRTRPRPGPQAAEVPAGAGTPEVAEDDGPVDVEEDPVESEAEAPVESVDCEFVDAEFWDASEVDGDAPTVELLEVPEDRESVR